MISDLFHLTNVCSIVHVQGPVWWIAWLWSDHNLYLIDPPFLFYLRSTPLQKHPITLVYHPRPKVVLVSCIKSAEKIYSFCGFCSNRILPYLSLYVCVFVYQSHKNPVSASAMLTGKFLQIQKVFATSSLLAEEFPDTLQYKISR